MSQENEQPAVTLHGADTPSDQGLSTLGMLMQLAGSVFAAVICLSAFSLLLAPGMRGQKLWILLLLASCVGRSLLHRHAGSELLYGKRATDDFGGGPLSATHKYILAGLLHSAFMAALLVGKFQLPMAHGLGLGLGLAVWPIALAVLLRLPRFRRFQTELPVPEDKGFEGAAILMVVFGTCGVLGAGAVLYFLLFEVGSALMRHNLGVLMLGATVLLVIRSGLHVAAGLSGLRETSVDRAVEQASRYANFGVISSFCVGAAFLLMSMQAAFHPAVLALVAGISWVLLAWPLIIRRFFSDRQFSDLLAGDQAAQHRRAPDAGLTSLGWLLFGHAMMGASLLVPELVAGGNSGGMGEMFGALGPVQTESVWWGVGVCVLQAWAGLELIRMSPISKVLATIYALVATAFALYSVSSVVDTLAEVMRGPESALMVAPLAISLVIPVATLVLVNRKIMPTATARFRAKPPEA